MLIQQQHKDTIKDLVEADPEVALATCDIPHLDPTTYLTSGDADSALPYCGCFVGVYAWSEGVSDTGKTRLCDFSSQRSETPV